MLFFKLLVASLVKEITNISSGLILHLFTRYTILPIIVRLLPEPAPATTRVASSFERTTLDWYLSSG